MHNDKSDLIVLRKGREQKTIRIPNLGEWEIAGYARSGMGMEIDAECLISEIKTFDDMAVNQQEYCGCCGFLRNVSEVRALA